MITFVKIILMQKIVVLTGAGISAESGIKTFRDSDGLWEEYRIEDVATYDAWQRNQDLVIEFYNQRRKQLLDVKPNAAHYALADLESKFDVQIITQNVDDLHERAGSSKILHLHGELKKVRSTVDGNLIYNLDGWELKKGDKCEKGSQLRPHIVWFGEDVPLIVPAAKIAEQADIFMVIGTSMNVYPAAGLLNYVHANVPKYFIDPNAKDNYNAHNLTVIKEKAGIALPNLVAKLLTE
jgi:NAD-dependent deacetylase